MIAIIGVGFSTNVFGEKGFFQFQAEEKLDIAEVKLQKKYQQAGQTINH